MGVAPCSDKLLRFSFFVMGISPRPQDNYNIIRAALQEFLKKRRVCDRIFGKNA